MEYKLDDYIGQSDDESIDENFVFVDEVEIIDDFVSTDAIPSILGLLSKKNNINKYMSWWSHKASKIEAVINEDVTSVHQPTTLVPFSHIEYAYKNGEMSQTFFEFWERLKKAMLLDDAKSQTARQLLWTPYTNLEVDIKKMITISSDIDTSIHARKNRLRLLHGENVHILGYTSIPLFSKTLRNDIIINVDKYDRALRAIKVGDDVYMTKKSKGVVIEKNRCILTIKEDDTNRLIKFSIRDWSRNTFFLYSRQFEPKISKKCIFKHTIYASGAKAKEFLTVSMRDILLHSKHKLKDYPSVIYNHDIRSDVLKDAYSRIDPLYLTNDSKPICNRLNIDINSIQYFKTKTIIQKNLDVVYALKMVQKRMAYLRNGSSSIDILEQNDVHNTDSQINFVWDVKNATPDKSNVIIVPMFLYKEQIKSGQERRSLPAFPAYFNLENTSDSVWEIGEEFFPRSTLDAVDVASKANQVYFDKLSDLIHKFKDFSKLYQVKSSFKYKIKARDGLEIHGISEPEEVDDMGEQGIMFENAVVDTDEDEEEAFESKAYQAKSEISLFLMGLVHEGNLKPIDMKRIDFLKKSKVDGIERALAYIIIVAQIRYPDNIFQIENTDLMLFPAKDNLFSVNLNTYLKRYHTLLHVEKIKAAYLSLPSIISWISKDINKAKESYVRTNRAFDEYGMWFTLRDDIVIDRTRNIETQTIYCNGGQDNSSLQDSSFDSVPLRNDYKPQTIEALINILYQDSTHFQNSDVFRDLKENGVQDLLMHNMSTKLDDRLTGILGQCDDKKKLAKILSAFIQSDLKSTIGKIMNRYFLKTDDSKKLHLDDASFCQIIKEYFDNETIVDKCNEALECIKSKYYYVEMDDCLNLVFIQLFVIHNVIGFLPLSLQDFIISRMTTKVEINNLTIEDIRLKYEKSRERKKKSYMHAYEGMPDEMRKLTKQLVDFGLKNRDSIITDQAENVKGDDVDLDYAYDMFDEDGGVDDEGEYGDFQNNDDDGNE
jgi:hypothetical protein